MYKPQSSLTAVETQDKLCAALLKLLRHNTLKDVKISVLCQKAGVSRNAFYRNFETIDDILVYHADKVCIEMSEYLNSLTSKSMESFISGFFKFWYAHKDDLELFFQNNISNLLIERISENLELCLSLPTQKPSPNPIKGYVFLASGMIGVLYTWIRKRYNIDPDTLANWIVENLRCEVE